MTSPAENGDIVALSEAVLAISAKPDLEGVLQLIVDQSRVLIGARYGALGLPDPTNSRLERLLVSGMTAAEQQAIGASPVGRGLLGVVLRDGLPLRLADIAADPRAVGFPAHHPPMTSLLGVPIRRGADVLGDLYLTDKLGAPEFSAADQALLELLAEHAALAIVNARLMGQLAWSEQRYRLLTESAPEIIFAVDQVGRITFINDRVRTIVGFEPEMLVGRLLRLLVVAEDRPVVDIQLRSMRDGAARATFPVRAEDTAGALRHFEVSLVTSPGPESGFQGVAQDTTERHALAREMADRNRELADTREAQAELRAFVSLIIQAQEDERARIAGDLHDSTVQTLTAIARRLQTLALQAPDPAGALRSELTLLADAAQAEADEVRRLSRNLRPSVLDHLGLAAGLEQLAADLRVQHYEVTLHVDGDAARLPDHARTALFRIAQEALTNVRRHSMARSVGIHLSLGGRDVTLSVADDGHGFDAAAPRPGPSAHMGLAGMRERATILGGTLEVFSRLGGGTRIVAQLPL
jgi:PAS domain S-box-containing protein